DGYEELIRSTIFPDILDRGIDGLFRLDLYRRAGDVETEFMTVMWFTNHEAIVRFAGPDWETAVVPASARAVLSRFDEKAAHYESRVAKEGATVVPTMPMISSITSLSLPPSGICGTRKSRAT